MNDTDVIDCVFPFLHSATFTASTFKKLRLVNKRFNSEFKDKFVIVMFNTWFSKSALLYFQKSSVTLFTDYSCKNNIFRFKILCKRYLNHTLHDATFTIQNGQGVLSLDSGVIKNKVIIYDYSSDDDYSSSSSDDDNDENSDFYDRTIKTFQNIQKVNDLKKVINIVIRNVNYY